VKEKWQRAAILEGFDLQTFGDLLKFFRLKKGLSQEALAKKIGMTRRQTLGDWETGTLPRTDSRSYIGKIADVLELTPYQRDTLFRAATLPLAPPDATSSSEQQNETFPSVSEPRNPYKGLRSFTQHDAADFFGREEFTQTIIKQLSPPKPSHSRFLALLGASGVGKSSLIQAGVIPYLRLRCTEASWSVLDPIRPGTDPFDALAHALIGHLPGKTYDEIRRISANSGKHISLFEELSGTNSDPVVLIIDQGEELFTQTKDEALRTQFLDLLVKLSTAKDGSCWVIFVARSDFSRRFQCYSVFWHLVASNCLYVQELTEEELRAAVQGPANLPDVQIVFEGYLIHTLLLEVLGRPGGLPLLQFVLNRLFQARQGNCLTERAYREMGGIRGAIGRYAQEKYEAMDFSERERRLLVAILMRLAAQDLSVSHLPTRRSARLDEFRVANAEDTAKISDLLTLMIAARLLTATENARGEPIIELAHEALLEEWPLLRETLETHYKELAHLHQLSQAARDWREHGQKRDRIYHGSQLKEARAWARRNILSQQEATFLRFSFTQRVLFSISIAVLILLLFSLVGIAAFFYHIQPPDPTQVTTLQNAGVGSLRWAVDNAPSGKVITFAPHLRGSISLTDELLISGKRFFIQGPGTDKLTISIHTQDIEVNTDTSLTLSDLTITGGNESKTSVLNNQGILTLIRCTVSGNIATGSKNGGGITNNGGTLTLTSSTVSNTATTINDSGEGITNNTGTVTVTNSTISNNTGGGITNLGDGMVTLTNSTVSGNSGGGVTNLGGGIVTLTNSTISGNSVYGDKGGGGITNGDGTVILTNSTIFGNTSSYGGGIDNGATMRLTNSTIFGNTASNTGGGIFSYAGSVTLTFCTLVGNSATFYGGGLATVRVFPYPNSSTSTLQNSLIAENNAPRGPDIAGDIRSKGYNLIQETPSARLQSTDRTGISLSALKLDPTFQLNGSKTTLTVVLLSGSSAIDAIPLESCRIKVDDVLITTDQRGIKRPQGSACDIGAYEYVP
jgi:transcriptional regulator with XRE-family HTH domain